MVLGLSPSLGAGQILRRFGSDLSAGCAFWSLFTATVAKTSGSSQLAPADRSGGKVGYQTLINSALREYVEGKTPKWEDTLRRIIREEMSRNNAA
jgi:hypothetical protein